MKRSFAADLSSRLAGREVQYFSTHRVSDGHVLARAFAGKMTRYFGHFDGEEAQEGELTQAELDCGFKINRPAEEFDEDYDYWFLNEDFIFSVAGKWSVDPSMIGTDIVAPVSGFIGHAPSATADQPPAPEPARSHPVASRPASRLRRALNAILGS
jgi:hypothetical protein